MLEDRTRREANGHAMSAVDTPVQGLPSGTRLANELERVIAPKDKIRLSRDKEADREVGIKEVTWGLLEYVAG